MLSTEFNIRIHNYWWLLLLKSEITNMKNLLLKFIWVFKNSVTSFFYSHVLESAAIEIQTAHQEGFCQPVLFISSCSATRLAPSSSWYVLDMTKVPFAFVSCDGWTLGYFRLCCLSRNCSNLMLNVLHSPSLSNKEIMHIPECSLEERWFAWQPFRYYSTIQCSVLSAVLQGGTPHCHFSRLTVHSLGQSCIFIAILIM